MTTAQKPFYWHGNEPRRRTALRMCLARKTSAAAAANWADFLHSLLRARRLLLPPNIPEKRRGETNSSGENIDTLSLLVSPGGGFSRISLSLHLYDLSSPFSEQVESRKGGYLKFRHSLSPMGLLPDRTRGRTDGDGGGITEPRHPLAPPTSIP